MYYVYYWFQLLRRNYLFNYFCRFRNTNIYDEAMQISACDFQLCGLAERMRCRICANSHWWVKA